MLYVRVCNRVVVSVEMAIRRDRFRRTQRWAWNSFAAISRYRGGWLRIAIREAACTKEGARPSAAGQCEIAIAAQSLRPLEPAISPSGICSLTRSKRISNNPGDLPRCTVLFPTNLVDLRGLVWERPPPADERPQRAIQDWPSRAAEPTLKLTDPRTGRAFYQAPGATAMLWGCRVSRFLQRSAMAQKHIQN
jgi:hypothetical protein